MISEYRICNCKYASAKYSIRLILRYKIEWGWPGFQRWSSFLRKREISAVFGLFSLCGEKGGGRQARAKLRAHSEGWLGHPPPHVYPPGNRDQRVGVFNFGMDRVRVLEKTSGSGSGTDWVRVLALHFYQSGIIGYWKSWSGIFWLHPW